MGDGHALTLVADIASLIVNYVNGNIKESTLNHIVYFTSIIVYELYSYYTIHVYTTCTWYRRFTLLGRYCKVFYVSHDYGSLTLSVRSCYVHSETHSCARVTRTWFEVGVTGTRKRNDDKYLLFTQMPSITLAAGMCAAGLAG